MNSPTLKAYPISISGVFSTIYRYNINVYRKFYDKKCGLNAFNRTICTKFVGEKKLAKITL
jgi:hypothetical protein